MDSKQYEIMLNVIENGLKYQLVVMITSYRITHCGALELFNSENDRPWHLVYAPGTWGQLATT